MSLTLIPTAAPQPAWCSTALANIDAHAYDHPDIDAYQAAITEASALVVRLRQIAAGCSRAKPLLEFAEQIEDAAFPLETEAMDWNDGRDGRAWGDKLDARRLVREE